MQPITHHDHAASLGASQDFINTLENSEDGAKDDLATPHDAVVYLAYLGVAHHDDLGAQAERDGPDRWLERVRDARAAMRELWDSTVEGRAPGQASLDTINGLLDRSPRVELRATLAGVDVSHRHPEQDPTGEALARVATPLVEAIAKGDTGRFRICANEDCRWVFEDESRAGRRRWCDMTSCGNRAKVRRYRERQKANADLPPPR